MLEMLATSWAGYQLMHARLNLVVLLALAVAPAAAIAQYDEPVETVVSEYFDSPEPAGTPAEFASFFQPRFQTPADAVSPEPSRSTRTQARSFSSYTRLARAPNMFGDLIFSAGQLVLAQRDAGTVITDLPLGGGRSFKIGENNKPIPMDRIYFNYNGYVNAVTFASGQFGPVPVSTNINQYTFGFEKTFLDGFWSVDVRMPITDGFQAASEGFAIDSGRFGNMAAFLKHMFYQDDELALAYGCGVGLPTGSNLDTFVDGARITVQNDAVHLLPYVGFFDQLGENWFMQGFFGLDFATTGNDVVVGPPGRAVGRLNEQNLMHADLSLGRWLSRTPEATYGQGLAAIFELHYTTTIQDSDTINFADFTQVGFVGGTLNNPANRVDLLNLTLGLHWQITELSNFRVGCAVPVRASPDRAFDAEIQASFNRYF
jgi:hypothetical protein